MGDRSSFCMLLHFIRAYMMIDFWLGGTREFLVIRIMRHWWGTHHSLTDMTAKVWGSGALYFISLWIEFLPSTNAFAYRDQSNGHQRVGALPILRVSLVRLSGAWYCCRSLLLSFQDVFLVVWLSTYVQSNTFCYLLTRYLPTPPSL